MSIFLAIALGFLLPFVFFVVLIVLDSWHERRQMKRRMAPYGRNRNTLPRPIRAVREAEEIAAEVWRKVG